MEYFRQSCQSLAILFGITFKDSILKIDHWIALLLLSSIGINMIKESLGKENNYNDSIDVSTMIVLSIATSIDALAVRNNFCMP